MHTYSMRVIVRFLALFAFYYYFIFFQVLGYCYLNPYTLVKPVHKLCSPLRIWVPKFIIKYHIVDLSATNHFRNVP